MFWQTSGFHQFMTHLRLFLPVKILSSNLGHKGSSCFSLLRVRRFLGVRTPFKTVGNWTTRPYCCCLVFGRAPPVTFRRTVDSIPINKFLFF